MNACRLSFNGLKRYVYLMVEKGLLEYEPMVERYKPTEKGLLYLQTYEEMNQLFGLINVLKRDF